MRDRFLRLAVGTVFLGGGLVGLNCSDQGSRTTEPIPSGGIALTALVPSRTIVQDTVVVEGRSFGAVQETSAVFFTTHSGTIPAEVVPGRWSDRRIEVLVPGAAVSGPVRVHRGGAETNALDFQIASPSTFVRDVLPILQGQCAACHGESSHFNGLIATTQAGLLRGGDHGPAVLRRKSALSLILQKIGPNPPFGSRMPQSGPPYLTDAEILQIADWIDQGAKADGTPLPQPPEVAVAVPNGGETWPGGSTQDIVYTATDADTPADSVLIRLEYSTDSGTSWQEIASAEINTGSYSWRVVHTATSHARVRVTASDGQRQASDVSNADFTITVPPPPTPHILELVPTRTVVGDTVEVVGSQFGALQGDGKVHFSGPGGSSLEAAVLQWSDTLATVLVPETAQSGPLGISIGTVESNPAAFEAAPLPLVSYTADLLPLFEHYGCASCHGGGNNLFVTPYASLMQGNSFHGPVILRRRSAQSILIMKIGPNYESAYPTSERMPLGGMVSAGDAQKFADWVDQGARDN